MLSGCPADKASRSRRTDGFGTVLLVVLGLLVQHLDAISPITRVRIPLIAPSTGALASGEERSVLRRASAAHGRGDDSRRGDACVAPTPGQGTPLAGAGFRPPAVPLVTHDPYFSIWSCADHLTDDDTRHWTGTEQPLTSLIRIDGKSYRLMGREPRDLPALPQVVLRVLPTRTIYEFQGPHASPRPEVRVTLTFLTPALPNDLDTLARPVTYLSWDVRSIDGKPHAVSVYQDTSAMLAIDRPGQRVVGSRQRVGDLVTLRFGSEDQPILARKGDNLRIDWGYVYAAAPRRDAKAAIGAADACRRAFLDGHEVPERDDTRMPRAANEGAPVMALAFDLGLVPSKPVSRHLMLAYDDLYAITYFRQRLRPYWRRGGAQAADLLRRAARDYPALQARCKAFDDELMADLARAGGEKYARLCALAYRQCLAANKLAADPSGAPLLFPKENFSNGCIATVDVIYPMAPLFLLLSPTLAKASLAPVLGYAASDRWRFPFAPHDLGTYPIANGQVYGGGERTEENQMPVEESGNLLLLTAAIARQDGDTRFATRYWPQLTRWAQYLEARGFDPENQLCTDDFAGHLAHNVNLSAKAIEALAAYAMLCKLHGEPQNAARYGGLAAEMAHRWVTEANDGDHFRLAFDRPGTWSQKYNLVWDPVLGFNLFPPDVARTEIAFYRKQLRRYGLPLDSRKTYTKLDWTLWTATLGDSRDDFDALVSPVYDFLNETRDRVPMTDWYETTNARRVGFQARSVVGGVFIKMLANAAVWQKWARRDRGRIGDWAPLPPPRRIEPVVPTAQDAPVAWRYTMDRPGPGWQGPGFDESGWKTGMAGFGTPGTPGAVVRTEWKTGDLWVRREFEMPSVTLSDLKLWVHHDEDVEIYVDGTLAASAPGYTTAYEELPIRSAALAALKPGRHLLAAHCHQTSGGQYLDIGLVRIADRW